MPLRQREQALRFSVPVRARHSEIVKSLLFERTTLLMTHDDHRPTTEPTQPAQDGGVISAQPVALQFLEAVDERVDVVAGVRPVLVPRELHSGPRVAMCLLRAKGLQPALDLVDLLRQVDSGH